MAYFHGESNEMGFGNVTEGVSIQGMEAYIETLKIDILKGIGDKLSETAGMESAINAGWQGESRDKFFNKFNGAIDATKHDLLLEYQDLTKKLSELLQNYFEQDRKMLDD